MKLIPSGGLLIDENLNKVFIEDNLIERRKKL